MSFRLTILGCGSSGGVPRVAAGWGACDPNEPRNRRRRCSALVERRAAGGVTRVLIDTSPDLRNQLIDAGVEDLDAVVFTHDHADHTHGIDDLRPITIHRGKIIDTYLDEATATSLRRRFGYIFETQPGTDYPPLLAEHRIVPGRRLSVEGAGGVIALLPVPLQHGSITALGFRIGDVAYCPDVNGISGDSAKALSGLQTLIIDALRYTPHPSHFSLRETLAWIERLKPRRTILTNLHTDLDYRRLAAEVPAHVEPAFDGLAVDFSV
jgi:phosphoribosyl 1,2-cyclic phosphate phosphodiesterase